MVLAVLQWCKHILQPFTLGHSRTAASPYVVLCKLSYFYSWMSLWTQSVPTLRTFFPLNCQLKVRDCILTVAMYTLYSWHWTQRCGVGFPLVVWKECFSPISLWQLPPESLVWTRQWNLGRWLQGWLGPLLKVTWPSLITRYSTEEMGLQSGSAQSTLLAHHLQPLLTWLDWMLVLNTLLEWEQFLKLELESGV